LYGEYVIAHNPSLLMKVLLGAVVEGVAVLVDEVVDLMTVTGVSTGASGASSTGAFGASAGEVGATGTMVPVAVMVSNGQVTTTLVTVAVIVVAGRV